MDIARADAPSIIGTGDSIAGPTVVPKVQAGSSNKDIIAEKAANMDKRDDGGTTISIVVIIIALIVVYNLGK